MTGLFTYANLAKMAEPENLKALGLALLLSFRKHSDLSAACLSAGHDSFREERQPDQLYRADFHSSDVDEFPAAHHGLADASGKKRSHQQHSLSFVHLPELII